MIFVTIISNFWLNENTCAGDNILLLFEDHLDKLTGSGMIEANFLWYCTTQSLEIGSIFGKYYNVIIGWRTNFWQLCFTGNIIINIKKKSLLYKVNHPIKISPCMLECGHQAKYSAVFNLNDYVHIRWRHCIRYKIL